MQDVSSVAHRKLGSTHPTDTVLVFVENSYFDPTLVLDGTTSPVLAAAEVKTNLLSPCSPSTYPSKLLIIFFHLRSRTCS
jgi:hypothetical protein